LRPRALAVTGLGLAAAAPLTVGPASTELEQIVLAALYVIMALGLNVVVGFAGLLDLGYVAFFAIGAHVTAHFGSAFWAGASGGTGIHLDFLIILGLAIVATASAAVFIGVPMLRVRGDYVGIVTLAFGEIVGQLVANGREIKFLGGSLTGGDAGMSAIDPIDLPFSDRFSPVDLRPGTGSRSRSSRPSCSQPSGCATPAWDGPGLRCARTRTPPRAPGSRSCARS
jgi:branched-chain amino acid transport system permease protein